MCKGCAREKKRADLWNDCDRKTAGMLRPPATRVSFPFFAFRYNKMEAQRLKYRTRLLYLHVTRHHLFFLFFRLFFFHMKCYHLHFYNSFLSISRLLLWRTNGEKSIQYTGYWSTPITAEKNSVQGVGEQRGDWTQRSITYSISRFHGNRPSKDRGLPCILHLSISYTYCDNETVGETNVEVTWGSSLASTSTIKEIK